MRRYLYGATIFLSAFLLFQVQPIIAKMILPWFGGSSAVWSTCMLFFQTVLLLGYLYAHWLHAQVGPRRQPLLHTVVLAASLAALPILPNPALKAASGAPSLRILAMLGLTVGLPYFMLSSTSPLLQAWYARANRGTPYRLFALSNLASMLGLVSYPFLVEPNLTVHGQAIIWSVAYVCFAVLCAVTAWAGHNREATAVPVIDSAAGDGAPGLSLQLLWLGLAASASVLLLAVTTHLTQDIAAIPFLWIVPLAVYLLSFILCFDSSRYYRRVVFVPLFVGALLFMAWRLWPDRPRMLMGPAITLFVISLFACCMVCHGELSRLKPHPRYLTSFYLVVSLGGALGGLFAGLIAPNLFRAYYEFPIGLAVTAALAWWALTRGSGRRLKLELAPVLCAYVVCIGVIMRDYVAGYRVVERNFYSTLRVRDDGDPATDDDAARKLIHGTINHGQQMLREEYRRTPVAYFCPQTGIGRAMKVLEGRPRRIGILGLGCGTLAVYGRAGDTLRIYEINPLVVTIAASQFTYLKDTPAKVEVAVGDGRLLLEAEPDQQFDILVMDAFSGDSVPVHLITREGFATYFRHLKPDGILVVNITNTYLDLEPVMERAANAFGKTALAYHFTPADDDDLCYGCSWTLMMDPAMLAAHPDLRDDAKVLRLGRPFRIWTDDFSNMLSVLQ